VELLVAQFSGLNLLKDILVPLLAAWAGFWLATRKFKKERLWQEKYAAYQEILGAIEAMAFWAGEVSSETMMLPTIGWFDGKPAHELYAQAKRQIAKHVSIGRLLLSGDAVSALEELQTEVFREGYRADDERDHSGDPHEEQEEVRIHAQEVGKIITKYLPRITELARKDLGS